MCFACGNPNGGPYEKAAKFYVGQAYCSHLAARHDHATAAWEDRYGPSEEADYIQSSPTE